MLLARILSKIYKEDGIILIDAKGQKYICGNPNKKKPIILKLLRENLKWKLIVDPEIEFPEAYMRKEIIIENASLKEFLMQLVKNLGRNEVSSASFISKKIFQFYFNITRFLVSVQNISFKKPTFNGAKARGDVGEYEVEMGGPAEGIS